MAVPIQKTKSVIETTKNIKNNGNSTSKQLDQKKSSLIKKEILLSLHTLKPAPNSIKNKKRIGRGEGSKKGGTSTKGHNGQQSRAGYKTRRGFEGGQTPLQRRLPKFGKLKSTKTPHTPINLTTIATYAEKHKITQIDSTFLVTHKLVKKNKTYKILGSAKLPEKLEISAHSFSQKATEAIKEYKGIIKTL